MQVLYLSARHARDAAGVILFEGIAPKVFRLAALTATGLYDIYTVHFPNSIYENEF